MLHLAAQIVKYMRVHKKFWLGPLMTVLLVVGALVVFAHTSSVAPFIYGF